MMQLWIALGGLLALGFIFLRRYLRTEKGITLGSLFLRRKNVIHQSAEPDAFEVTVEEMIPGAEKIDPRNAAKAAILLKRAEVQMERGALGDAEKLLIQALALDPSAIEVYNRLGLIYLRQNQFSKAENIYRKLILTVINEPAFFSNLGMALYSQGKLQEAVTHYRKAIELDSTRAGRFFSLGQIMRELGEVDEALNHLRMAVEMEPRNLDYLLTLAELYIAKGMTDEARQLLAEILLIAPDNEMAKKLNSECRS